MVSGGDEVAPSGAAAAMDEDDGGRGLVGENPAAMGDIGGDLAVMGDADRGTVVTGDVVGCGAASGGTRVRESKTGGVSGGPE